MRNETFVAHAPVASTKMIFFLSQMAKLTVAMSSCFQKMDLVRKYGSRRTCEARSIANRRQRPRRRISRRNKESKKALIAKRSPRRPEHIRKGAHEFENDPELGIVAGR